MANKIQLQDRFDFIRDGITRSSTPNRGFTIDTTSEIVNSTVQVVGTSAEQLALGDATDTCYLIIENLHATAVIEYGYDDTGFVAYGAINPGDPPARLGRIDTLSTVYLQASAASTPVNVTLCKIV